MQHALFAVGNTVNRDEAMAFPTFGGRGEGPQSCRRRRPAHSATALPDTLSRRMTALKNPIAVSISTRKGRAAERR